MTRKFAHTNSSISLDPRELSEEHKPQALTWAFAFEEASLSQESEFRRQLVPFSSESYERNSRYKNLQARC